MKSKHTSTAVPDDIRRDMSDAIHRDQQSDGLINVLGIGDSDILHKVLDRFKAEIRGNHVQYHQDKFGYPSWRNCGKIGCATNFEAVRQAELLVYGEVQND